MNGFQQALDDHQLELNRGRTTTLQVNVGRLCNLACKHCHLSAGPERKEVMTRETMDELIRFAARHHFSVIDITGGSPELVPDIGYLLEQLAPLAQTTMMRTNLVALLDQERRELLNLCRRLHIALIASFSSVNRGQADAQRGKGVWDQSIVMLKRLNELGYGKPGTGLELYLVSNPAGAFMPVDQCTAEKKFKADLARKWGIEFTGLFTFANVPLGRFRKWLEKSGNLDGYMQKLAGSFNPETIDGLMCRSLINISWDGYLYDCDFNMAAGLPSSGKPLHISRVGHLEEGGAIMTDDYCFACTAGSGFT
ncbi:MAG TPA: radical SAM/Cys-rich domain protein [Desulfobacteraceae bacterium]|nr:radical SAM/Cys-rich domain protein [Desulfobacteraceae bacterium]